MLIGAHISVSRGLLPALEYARDTGSECIQIFAKSPRRWIGPPPDADMSRRFAEQRDSFGVKAVFTHTAYLINLAATDPEQRRRSIDALADEIVRGRLLQAEGVITHLGTDHLGDRDAAASRIAQGIEEAFAVADSEYAASGYTRLLLENSAGAGRTYGRDVSDFAAVFSAVGADARERMGVCIDTCHAHVAGVDVRTADAWERLIGEIEAGCGPAALRAIHANDCMFPFGSARDRHAWIGAGTLGSEAFSAMLGAPLGDRVCAIVEMPGDVPIKDIENVRRLRELRSALSEN